MNWTLTRIVAAKNQDQWRVDISNARDTPIKGEVLLPFGLEEKPAGADRGERGWVLRVDVAPNGTSSMTYSIKR